MHPKVMAVNWGCSAEHAPWREFLSLSGSHRGTVSELKREELRDDKAGSVPEKLDEHSGDRTSGPGRQGHQGTARVL